MFSLAFSLLILAQAPPAGGPADATAPVAQTTPAPAGPVSAEAPATPPATEPARPFTATEPAHPSSPPATAPASQTAPGALAPGTPAAPGPAAQTAGAGTQPTTEPPTGFAKFITGFNPLVLLALAAGLMIFFQTRSRRSNEKAQKERLNSIKRGDRVQTIGGILGNVVQADEKRILVKVDESNNTKIWFARDAIRGVLEEEKEKSEGKSGK